MPSFVNTWNRVMSNDPAVNDEDVGYAYVPGPFSSRESIPAEWDEFYLRQMAASK